MKKDHEQLPSLPPGTRILVDAQNPSTIYCLFPSIPHDQTEEVLSNVIERAAQTFNAQSVSLGGIVHRRTTTGKDVIQVKLILG